MSVKTATGLEQNKQNNMIELMASMYEWLMSGVCVSAIIAALFYWYAISRDMNDKDDFDKKYRASRDVEGRW